MTVPERHGKRRGEIIVDSRGRTSLAKVRSQRHDRYLVEEMPDGTLILTPAALVPAHLIRHPPQGRVSRSLPEPRRVIEP